MQMDLDTQPQSESLMGTSSDNSAAPQNVDNQATTSESQVGKWYDRFSDEYRSNPAITRYESEEDALKSLAEKDKLVGKRVQELSSEEIRKFLAPEELALIARTKEMPASLEEYNLPNLESYLSPEVSKALKERAFQTNMLPSQVEELVKFSYEANQMQMAAQQQAWKAQSESLYTKDDLKMARQAVVEFGGPDMVKHIEAMGLANNPEVIGLFSKIGKSMQEDRLPGPVRQSVQANADAIKSEIKSLLNDRSFKQDLDQSKDYAVRRMDALYGRLDVLEGMG
jgi:hypothetical protein